MLKPKYPEEGEYRNPVEAINAALRLWAKWSKDEGKRVRISWPLLPWEMGIGNRHRVNVDSVNAMLSWARALSAF